MQNGLKDTALPHDALQLVMEEEELQNLVKDTMIPNVLDGSENSGELQINIDEMVGQEETKIGSCGNDESAGLCEICIRHKQIRKAREASKVASEKQAIKMMQGSSKKFPPAGVGDTVLVKIPEVDRGRLAPRNVMAVVMNKTSDSDLYQLGTSSGIIQKYYARNEFQMSDTSFLNVQDVPEKEIPLRKIAANETNSKQGFVKCACKNYCGNKRCICNKKGIKCNSKCHSSSTCKNK